MKGISVLLLMLTLVGVSARTTRAHVDTLGAPDPQWQRFPDAPPETGPQALTDSGGVSPRGGLRVLEIFVYGAGTLFVLLALALLRSFWDGRRASDRNPTAVASPPP